MRRVWRQNWVSGGALPHRCASVASTQTPPPAHLSQGALHGPQEVGVAEAVVPGADVVQLKAEPLHLLKVVVHQEDLGEDGAAAAADHLRAVHLRTRIHTHTHRKKKKGWTPTQTL